MEKNKETMQNNEIDVRELEEVLGGMSGSREAKLRSYVDFFRKRGYTAGAIQVIWSERQEKPTLSRRKFPPDGGATKSSRRADTAASSAGKALSGAGWI